MKKIAIFETITHSQDTMMAIKSSAKSILDVEFVEDIWNADYVISFGGDGTLLDCVQKCNPNQIIIPVRDYKRCQFHDYFSHCFLGDNVEERDVLTLQERGNLHYGISEVTIRNLDITKAIRMNMYINDKPYALNIIGDGIICSTPLGSTGYFKNITNMVFHQGLGIGFMNNTQGMNNMIVSNNDKILINLTRGNAQISIDHFKTELHEGENIEIKRDNTQFIRLRNYKEFMCQNCRKKRHDYYC